jgi:hypothetical protein
MMARTWHSDAACIAAGSLQVQATLPPWDAAGVQPYTHVCTYLLRGLAAARVGGWKRARLAGRCWRVPACQPETHHAECYCYCYCYCYMVQDLPEHPVGSQRGSWGTSVIVRI